MPQHSIPLIFAVRIWLFVALVTCAGSVRSQDAAIRKRTFNTHRNVALEGYDPVAYFDGRPAHGELEYDYKGVIYRFTGETTLRRFKANPEKYEPAYGGWCAYAMGQNGEKVKIDPETFKIVDGKLYLFYNFWGNNTRERWNANEPELKARGDSNWRKLLSPGN